MNPYVYCAGDPVNRDYPSGYFSIASEVVKEPGMASILGWAGMAQGMVSGIGAGVLSKLAPEPVSVAGNLITRARVLFNKSEATLDSVVQRTYPIERRIMSNLDMAAVREMAFRIRTPETGVPEPFIRQADVYRRYARLPSDELVRVLAEDEAAGTIVDNPEFLTFMRKNMLDLGRSLPVSFNDPTPLFSERYPGWNIGRYQIRYDVYDTVLMGRYRQDYFYAISEQGMTDHMISDNWDKLDREFWVRF